MIITTAFSVGTSRVAISASNFARDHDVEPPIIPPKQKHFAFGAEHVGVDYVSIHPNKARAIFHPVQFHLRQWPPYREINRTQVFTGRDGWITPMSEHAADRLTLGPFDANESIVLIVEGRRISAYKANNNRFRDDRGASSVIFKSKLDGREIMSRIGSEPEKETRHHGQQQWPLQPFDNVDLALGDFGLSGGYTNLSPHDRGLLHIGFQLEASDEHQDASERGYEWRGKALEDHPYVSACGILGWVLGLTGIGCWGAFGATCLVGRRRQWRVRLGLACVWVGLFGPIIGALLMAR
jgi:hypothetical protein